MVMEACSLCRRPLSPRPANPGASATLRSARRAVNGSADRAARGHVTRLARGLGHQLRQPLSELLHPRGSSSRIEQVAGVDDLVLDGRSNSAGGVKGLRPHGLGAETSGPARGPGTTADQRSPREPERRRGPVPWPTPSASAGGTDRGVERRHARPWRAREVPAATRPPAVPRSVRRRGPRRRESGWRPNNASLATCPTMR